MLDHVKNCINTFLSLLSSKNQKFGALLANYCKGKTLPKTVAEILDSQFAAALDDFLWEGFTVAIKPYVKESDRLKDLSPYLTPNPSLEACIGHLAKLQAGEYGAVPDELKAIAGKSEASLGLLSAFITWANYEKVNLELAMYTFVSEEQFKASERRVLEKKLEVSQQQLALLREYTTKLQAAELGLENAKKKMLEVEATTRPPLKFIRHTAIQPNRLRGAIEKPFTASIAKDATAWIEGVDAAIKKRTPRIAQKDARLFSLIAEFFTTAKQHITAIQQIHKEWPLNLPRKNAVFALVSQNVEAVDKERKPVKKIIDEALDPRTGLIATTVAPLEESIRANHLKLATDAQVLGSAALQRELKKKIELADRRRMAVLAFADEQLDAERQLKNDAEKAKAEVARLKLLPKRPGALNAYLSFYQVSFDFFVSIGHLIAGSPEAKSMIGILSTPTLSGLSPPTTHGTGELKVSLKLGLSMGGKVFGAGASLGLALVYEASLESGDERNFATSQKFSLVATAGVKIPKLFKLSVEKELFAVETSMTFKDHYQWAAWICEKWARSWAKTIAADLFPAKVQADPKPEDYEELVRWADEVLKDDEHALKLLKKIEAYRNESYELGEARSLLAGSKVTVDLGKSRELEYESHAPVATYTTEIEVEQGKRKHKTKQEWGQSKKGTVKIGEFSASVEFEVDGAKDQKECEDWEEADLTLELPLGGLKAKGDKKEFLSVSSEGLVKAISELTKKKAAKVVTASKLPQADAAEAVSGDLLSTLTEGTTFQSSLGATLQIGLGIERGKAAAMKYWRLSVSWTSSLELTIPTPMPGLEVESSVEVEMSRTYAEHLGSDTLGYLAGIYGGLTERGGEPEKALLFAADKRPTGADLWKAFVKDHQSSLWALIKAVAAGKSRIIADIAEKKSELKIKGMSFIGVCAQAKDKDKLDSVILAGALQQLEPVLKDWEDEEDEENAEADEPDWIKNRELAREVGALKKPILSGTLDDFGFIFNPNSSLFTRYSIAAREEKRAKTIGELSKLYPKLSLGEIGKVFDHWRAGQGDAEKAKTALKNAPRCCTCVNAPVPLGQQQVDTRPPVVTWSTHKGRESAITDGVEYQGSFYCKDHRPKLF
jgi:hypothetical protein